MPLAYQRPYPPQWLLTALGAEMPTATRIIAPTDGITSASAAIQAVLNVSDNVYLPSGTYLITTPLVINANTTFTGAGWNTILKAANGLNDYVIKVTATAQGWRPVFYNFQIDANGENQTDGGGIKAAGSVQGLYDRLHIHHAYQAGLWLSGLLGGGTAHHNRVSNCLFDNNTYVNGPGHGLFIQSSDENMVTACDFEHCGGLAADPFAVRDWSGLNTYTSCMFVNGRGGIKLHDCYSSRIIGCVFDGVGYNNIELSGGRHSITSNYFDMIGDNYTANTANGIALLGGPGQNTISHNVFRSHTSSGHTKSAINEIGSNYNTVVGNQVAQVGTFGTGAYVVTAQNSIWANNTVVV